MPTPGQQYTIQPEDTLNKIATAAYGAANTGQGVTAIEQANPTIVPDDLQIGQKIYIPFLAGGRGEGEERPARSGDRRDRHADPALGGNHPPGAGVASTAWVLLDGQHASSLAACACLIWASQRVTWMPWNPAPSFRADHRHICKCQGVRSLRLQRRYLPDLSPGWSGGPWGRWAVLWQAVWDRLDLGAAPGRRTVRSYDARRSAASAGSVRHAVLAGNTTKSGGGPRSARSG